MRARAREKRATEYSNGVLRVTIPKTKLEE